MRFLEFKGSLFLPKTKFSMRAKLNVKELEFLKLSSFGSSKVPGKPISEIYDGPPFTNGNIHIGTALNKVLKDVIGRYTSTNHNPLIPGWDCHGLPIENKALSLINKKSTDFIEKQLKLRRTCKGISKKYISLQQKQFKRLGLLVD